jgi:CheY-like chemotaxis protein
MGALTLVHLLEPDDALAQRVSASLAGRGCLVHCSSDASDALRFLGVMVPSVIVMDLGAFGSDDAARIAARLATDPALRSVPKIAVGTQAPADDGVHAVFVRKPFDVAELVAAIAGVSPHALSG